MSVTPTYTNNLTVPPLLTGSGNRSVVTPGPKISGCPLSTGDVMNVFSRSGIFGIATANVAGFETPQRLS